MSTIKICVRVIHDSFDAKLKKSLRNMLRKLINGRQKNIEGIFNAERIINPRRMDFSEQGLLWSLKRRGRIYKHFLNNLEF